MFKRGFCLNGRTGTVFKTSGKDPGACLVETWAQGEQQRSGVPAPHPCSPHEAPTATARVLQTPLL